MKKNFYRFLVFSLLFFVGFFSGITYVLLERKRFQEVKIGTKLIVIERKWGVPDVNNNDLLENKIYHIYNNSPLNKYVFIYNKKDSLLIEKWKEY